MQAIIKSEKGTYVNTIPIPVYRDEEILIKVEMCGLCRTDSYVANNKISTTTPLILGHEFSGSIQEYGSKCTGWSIGQKVAVMPVFKDDNGHYTSRMLGVNANGAFAQYISVHQSMVFPLDDDYNMNVAAYLEPIAASLAVVDIPFSKKALGAIQGSGRISHLTLQLMKEYGWDNISIIQDSKFEDIADNTFDFVIETYINSDNIRDLIRVVKHGGGIILKSRSFFETSCCIKDIVQKDMVLYGKYYGSFEEAINIGKKNMNIQKNFGLTLGFDDFLEHLLGDKNTHSDKKIFLDPRLE